MLFWSFGRIRWILYSKWIKFVVDYSNFYINMDQNIFLLDISHLTEIDMATFIEGKIVLLDNIDSPSAGKAEQQSQNGFPVQARMSMVLLCLEGELRIRIALKEYVLHPNMFVIIIPGIIFEVFSISDDFRGFVVATRNDFMPVTEKTTQVMSFYKCLQEKCCFTFEEKDVPEFVKVYRAIRRLCWMRNILSAFLSHSRTYKLCITGWHRW